MPKVIVSVTNDLTTDNRVDKVCRSIQALGWEVVLVGRLLRNSLPLQRTYHTHRMRLFFTKGALFYAEYNLRLFFYLLFSRFDVLHANDLDTLLANGMVAKIRSKKLIYDTHEYFTETPEIQGRPLVKKTWEFIERVFFSLPVQVFTVNQSIANLYQEKYGRVLTVMRNIPEGNSVIALKTRAELGIPEDKFVLILQGSGINVDRGAEEMLAAMRFLDDTFLWLIVGNGDVVPQLKAQALQLGLNHRIQFFPKMPYAEMMQVTAVANLGLTLDKGTNLNYLYSLPNKIFDYLKAGVPVLASDLPEIKAIVETHQIGWVFTKHEPEQMATVIREIAHSPIYSEIKANTKLAAAKLRWENEVEELVGWYKSQS